MKIFSALADRIPICTTIMLIGILQAPASTSLLNSSYAQANDLVRITNTNEHTNILGYLTIFGEVLNESDEYVTNVQVDVLLNDKSGGVLHVQRTNLTKVTGQADDEPLTIPPGGMVGFKVLLDNKTLSSVVSTYDFEISYDNADEKPRTISITDSHVYRGDSSTTITNWIIVGELKNEDEDEVWDAYLIISLHDVSDRVVAVTEIDGAFTEQSPLEGGRSWAFFKNIHLPSDIDVRSVSVFAESEQSVIVPEFPFSFMIVIAASFAIFILLARIALMKIKF